TDVFPAVTPVQSSDALPGLAALARERDVPLLRGSGVAMRALARVALHRRARRPIVDFGPAVDLSDLLVVDGPLPEHESAAILERYGIEFPARRRAASPEEAAAAA